MAAFVLGGAQVGMAMGAATAAVIVVVAARSKFDHPFEIATSTPEEPGGLLVVALAPIEDPGTAGIVATIAEPLLEDKNGGVMLLAPARGRLLDRWTDDLERAQFESQRLLTVSVATLAAAGVPAEGRVGDGDPVQAVEDALRSYPATAVVVVSEPGRDEAALAALEHRLPLPLRRVSSA